MITDTAVILIACIVALSFPYAYFIARICSVAYFEQKLSYQKQFFKKFDIPHNAGTH